MGPCVQDSPRKTIDRLIRVLVEGLPVVVGCPFAAHGSRVTAYGMPVYGSWCPMWKGRGQFSSLRCEVEFPHLVRLVHVASAWQEIQPRRVFKKQVSYPAVIKSIDCPYISSPRLPSPSQLRLPWFAFEVWTAVEQSLSGGWGYTVRSRHNGSDSEPRRIRMISGI